MTRDSLVGKFFHTYRDGVLGRQGEVLSCVAPGLYLVQTFEWLLGTPNEEQLEPVTNMVGWKFYECREDWQRAYEMYRHKKAQGDNQ